ncbi:MAG: hypothetical protein AB1610_00915 [Nitrospirota bacterium]
MVSIGIGYYLLLTISPDAPFEEVVKKARAGTISTLIGGIMAIIYIFRRTE